MEYLLEKVKEQENIDNMANIEKEAVLEMKRIYNEYIMSDNIKLQLVFLDNMAIDPKHVELSTELFIFLVIYSNIGDITTQEKFYDNRWKDHNESESVCNSDSESETVPKTKTKKFFNAKITRLVKKYYKCYINSECCGVTDSLIHLYILTKLKDFKWKEYLKNHKITKEVYKFFKESIDKQHKNKPVLYKENKKVDLYVAYLETMKKYANNECNKSIVRFLEENLENVTLYYCINNAESYYDIMDVLPREEEKTIDYLIMLLFHHNNLEEYNKSYKNKDIILTKLPGKSLDFFDGFLHPEDGMDRNEPIEAHKYEIIRSFLHRGVEKAGFYDDIGNITNFHNITPELYEKYRYEINKGIKFIDERLYLKSCHERYIPLVDKNATEEVFKTFDLQAGVNFCIRNKPVLNITEEDQKYFDSFLKQYFK